MSNDRVLFDLINENYEKKMPIVLYKKLYNVMDSLLFRVATIVNPRAIYGQFASIYHQQNFNEKKYFNDVDLLLFVEGVGNMGRVFENLNKLNLKDFLQSVFEKDINSDPLSAFKVKVLDVKLHSHLLPRRNIEIDFEYSYISRNTWKKADIEISCIVDKNMGVDIINHISYSKLGVLLYDYLPKEYLDSHVLFVNDAMPVIDMRHFFKLFFDEQTAKDCLFKIEHDTVIPPKRFLPLMHLRILKDVLRSDPNFDDKIAMDNSMAARLLKLV